MTTCYNGIIAKQNYEEARGELVRDMTLVGKIYSKSEVKRRIDEVVKIALDNQMKEVMECLPGTVVLDQSFYENQDSKEFIEWAAYCKYKEDLLTNLKSRGLI